VIMPDINSMSDAALGRMVRAAAEGKEDELETALHSQRSLAEFCTEIGLVWLASTIMDAIGEALDAIFDFFANLFS
jgi:hypothetical protein